MHDGVVFASTGWKYRREASEACERVRRHMPDIGVAIVTDEPDHDAYAGDRYDSVIELPTPTHGFPDKNAAMRLSPFERTLYLDTDAFVIAPLHEVFEMLEQYDFAITPKPRTQLTEWPDVPRCFYETNAGVIGFRRSPRAMATLEHWSALYERGRRKQGGEPGFRNDQPSFTRAIWEMKATAYMLPTEYNLRTHMPAYLRDEVKILHGRPANLAEIETTINEQPRPLVYPGHPDDRPPELGPPGLETAAVREHLPVAHQA